MTKEDKSQLLKASEQAPGVSSRDGKNPLKRIEAIVFGHAIADALGVPVEFESREELKKAPVKGMLGYGTHYVPAGTWSDDTSMALATLDSLSGGVNYDDMMEKFCEWKSKAAYTATDEVFDMGISTNTALSRYQNGIPALQCGCDGENDNGNGVLMRIYPVVLYWYYRQSYNQDRYQLIEFVYDASKLTHSHFRSQMGCGIYAYILASLLDNPSKEGIYNGLKDAWNHFSSYHAEVKHYERLFDTDFDKISEDEIKSTGYVVATLEAAIWCVLNTNSYSECVLKAVNLGSDTDTVAAIAGSLAGAIYGLEDVPMEWRSTLLKTEYIRSLCKKFYEGIYKI